MSIEKRVKHLQEIAFEHWEGNKAVYQHSRAEAIRQIAKDIQKFDKSVTVDDVEEMALTHKEIKNQILFYQSVTLILCYVEEMI